MGASSSHSGISKEQLDEYEELTYLSKAEIVYLIKSFSVLDKNLNQRVPFRNVCDQFQQLKYNPFNDRICEVFSSYEDGCFSFEDILDLYSVMSENCPSKVKAAWAFRIFDFDRDNKIGEDDLITVIERLTLNITGDESDKAIPREDKEEIARILLSEMDIESSGKIGALAFQHGVGKMSEFPHSFSFRS